MGIGSLVRSNPGLSLQGIPERKGLLGVLTKPLEALNAPMNSVKSIVRGFQTGDISYFGNAFTTFIPGAGSEEILAEEVTGSKNIFVNLAFDIFGDPINLLGGVGVLTKFGRLSKSARTITSAIRVADQAGDAKRANEFRLALEKVTKEIVKVGAGKPERAIVNIGLPFTKGKDIGDFKSISKQLDRIPINLLPDPRKIAAQKELDSVTRLFNRASELGRDTTKLEAKIADLTDAASGYKSSIFSERVAERLQGLKNRFKYDADNELTQSTYDFVQTKIAKDTHNFKSGQVVGMISDVEDLVQSSNLGMAAVLTRLTRGSEARNVGAGKVSLDDISARFAKEITKTRKNTSSRIKKIIKSEKDVAIKAQGINKILDATAKRITSLKVVEETNKLQLREAEKVWGALGAPEVKFIRTYADRLDGLVAIESKLGIKIKSKDTAKTITAYVRRVVTPRGLAWMHKSKANKEATRSIMSHLSIKLGAAHKRTLLPEFEITKVNEVMRRDYGLGFDFFSTDLIEGLVKRNVEHINAIHRAQGVHILAGVHGVPKQAGQKGFVSVDELFKRTGLEVSDKFKDMVIPKSIMDDAFRSDKFLQSSILNEKAVSWFIDSLEVINRPYRKWLTVIFPAFHMRNAISNWMLNGIGGVGTYHLKNMVEIGRFQWRVKSTIKAGRKLNPEDAARLSLLVENRMVNSRAFMHEMGGIETASWAAETKNYKPFQPNGRIEAVATRVMGENVTKVGHAVAQSVPNLGFQFGSFLEDNARIAHFEGKMKQGLTTIEAARSTNRYLFDYNKLTNFEKDKVKPFFLFYTWMRNNVPLMAQTAFTEPRKFAAYAKLVGIGDDELPTYLRGSSAFKNPFGSGFIASIGAPMEDFNIINTNDVNPLFFEQLPRVFEKMVSRASPAVRIPIELMTGRTTFNRKPLRNIPIGELISSNLPISRVTGTVGKLFDPERPTGFKVMDLISGIRTYDISDIKAKLDTVRRKAIGTRKFRQEGFLVFPKKDFKDDPIVIRIKKEMARLNKRLRKERKRR